MALEHEHHELTEFQNGQIVEGPKFSLSSKIARDLNIPRQTIDSFLSHYDQREIPDNLPPPGRPQKLCASDVRYLVHTAESNTDVPLKEISVNGFPDVSKRTLYRRLLEEGIRKWRAAERTLLTKERAAKHLKWARAHKHWTRDD